MPGCSRVKNSVGSTLGSNPKDINGEVRGRWRDWHDKGMAAGGFHVGNGFLEIVEASVLWSRVPLDLLSHLGLIDEDAGHMTSRDREETYIGWLLSSSGR